MRILNHYTCAQIFQRLDDYLDRELSPAEIASVEEHLQAGAVCAAEFAFQDEVLRQVRYVEKALKSKVSNMEDGHTPPNALRD